MCAYVHKTLKSKVVKDLSSGISDTGFHRLWMEAGVV